MNKMIEKQPFRQYNTIESKDKKPLSVKLNDRDEEMLSIGMYAFNMHSKSGVLKELAELGLKVILNDLGADKLHYLTRGDRTRLIHNKPRMHYFSEKGNSENQEKVLQFSSTSTPHE